MNPTAIEEELSTLTVLVDTREQPTTSYKARLESTGYPYERQKLDFGDYSAKTSNFTLEGKVSIERKMNLDELAMCFGSQRKRFKAEFERAKASNAKTYLLIENANWDCLISDSAYSMRCNSKYTRKAMFASVLAWSARYNIIPLFCTSENSGQLIGQILYREMKEVLSNVE